jgi:hypothetical protein
MSYFINNDNQNLLWTVINNADDFKQVFYPGSPYNSNSWFRAIIQKFHEESPTVQKHELNIFNRRVLSFMLEQLKTANNTSYSAEKTSIQPPYIEKKEDIYQKQFMERQQQYDVLLQKPIPPKPEFGDNIKDEAISNMDELILAQKKMREDELKAILPPSSSASVTENITTIVTATETTTSEKQVVATTNKDIEIIMNRLSRIEEDMMKFSEILQSIQLDNFTLKST